MNIQLEDRHRDEGTTLKDVHFGQSHLHLRRHNMLSVAAHASKGLKKGVSRSRATVLGKKMQKRNIGSFDRTFCTFSRDLHRVVLRPNLKAPYLTM